MSRILLLGASGMIGQLVLQKCLNNPFVSQVTILSRKPLGVDHDKLAEHIHPDFYNYDDVKDQLRDINTVFFCIGAYTGSLPKDAFRKINVDMPVALGKTLKSVNPSVRFCLLSGQGADRSETSKTQFASDKGAAENQLDQLELGEFYSFRPGYIYPVTPRQEPNMMYKFTRAIYPVIQMFGPSFSITSEALADCMVHVGLNGHPKSILENRDLRSLIPSLTHA